MPLDRAPRTAREPGHHPDLPIFGFTGRSGLRTLRPNGVFGTAPHLPRPASRTCSEATKPPHVDSRHRKTPSRVRFRPPPPGTFRVSPCGIQRTALRNGFNLVASRTRCDGNATRAELTDQEVGPRKFAKSASFVLAPDEYRLEPRARPWAGEADVEGGVAKRIREESPCGRAAQSVALTEVSQWPAESRQVVCEVLARRLLGVRGL